MLKLKRILNVHLYREQNQLVMQLIDVYPRHRIDDLSTGQTWHIIPEGVASLASLSFNWSLWNNLKNDGGFLKEINLHHSQHSILINSNESQEISDDLPLITFTQENETVYYYENVTLNLPQADETKLLMILIGLDSTICRLQDNNNYELNLCYKNSVPDLSDRAQYIKEAFASCEDASVKQTLSRHVATWLISEVSDQALAATLRQLLASDQSSLTQGISQKLYPQSTIEDFIRNHCKEDSAMSALFNPAIPCLVAEKALKKEIRSQVKDMSQYAGEQAVIEWYKEFAKLRRVLWNQMIQCVFGEAAPDDGLYDREYTEIELLSSADLNPDEQSNLTLRYVHTPSYKKYYMPSKELNSQLEEELRAVCELMGLRFLPNQDFHGDFVSFDEESTTFLKNRGFHITEDFCNSLLKPPRRYHLFNEAGGPAIQELEVQPTGNEDLAGLYLK